MSAYNLSASILLIAILISLLTLSTVKANAATREVEFEWAYNYYNDTATLVKYIGNETSVLIPEKVNGFKVTAVGKQAFADTNVASIQLPGAIQTIGEGAFQSCEFLKQINIPNSVTEIQDNAFYECKSLELIKLPDGLKYLGWNAFEKCKSLTSITIPKNLKELNWGTFKSCTSLQTVTILPGLTTIRPYAFIDCVKLKTVNLPSSVKNIGIEAFNNCKSLSTIKFPAGIQVISAYAFEGCTSLESIVIPKTVKELQYMSFGGCTSLKKAIIYGSPYIGLAEGFLTPTSILSVYGYAGSSVQEMAKKDGLHFVALNKPTSLKGSVLSKRYSELTWKSAKGATAYQIYRSTKKSSGYTKLAETKGTTYSDKKVKRGSTYYYKVRMYLYDVDKVKLYGQYTGVVAVKVMK